MNLLLDTQVLIWCLAADRRLKRIARQAVENDSNRVWVSAVSAWEIGIKSVLGKLLSVRRSLFGVHRSEEVSLEIASLIANGER